MSRRVSPCLPKSKYILIEGSLEVKLPTIWTDEKQSRAEAERREKIRREKSRRERVRRKRMQMREKVGKSRNTVFFPMVWGSGGSKSRLAKVAGAELAGQMGDEKLHAVVAKAHFQAKMYKAHQLGTTFGSWDVEKSARLLWREAHFQVKMLKAPGARTTFRGSDVVSRGRRKGLCAFSKWAGVTVL